MKEDVVTLDVAVTDVLGVKQNYYWQELSEEAPGENRRDRAILFASHVEDALHVTTIAERPYVCRGARAFAVGVKASIRRLQDASRDILVGKCEFGFVGGGEAMGGELLALAHVVLLVGDRADEESGTLVARSQVSNVQVSKTFGEIVGKAGSRGSVVVAAENAAENKVCEHALDGGPE